MIKYQNIQVSLVMTLTASIALLNAGTASGIAFKVEDQGNYYKVTVVDASASSSFDEPRTVSSLPGRPSTTEARIYVAQQFYQPGWCSAAGSPGYPTCFFNSYDTVLASAMLTPNPPTDPGTLYTASQGALVNASRTDLKTYWATIKYACAVISPNRDTTRFFAYACEPVNIAVPASCEVTTANPTIDFLTFNASELRTGRKQSTQVNIQCTGAGGTVNVSSNEYDTNGKKIIKTDNGDPLYAIITANLNGGEKPVTPTGQPLTLVEGGNPLTLWADIRANEPQKHEGFFTNTSVITLTYQ